MIKNEATISVDGSGSVEFKIELQTFFLEVMIDLADFAGENQTLADGKLFDLEKIREDFAEKPNLQLKSLSSPSPESLEGEFSFQEVEEVFKGEAGLTEAGIISFSQQGEEKTFSFHLDRDNFSQVSRFLTFMDNPFFQMFSPEENEGTTEEEYLEMIEFALGEKGPPAIKESHIELKVNVKGKIISQTGGELLGNSVLFKIPLIRILMLDEPLDYAVVFR